MEPGAKGCEVVVSGKLCATRAKSMKFTGRRIYKLFVTLSTTLYLTVLLRQPEGVLGIKVKILILNIMKGYDPESAWILQAPVWFPNHLGPSTLNMFSLHDICTLYTVPRPSSDA